MNIAITWEILSGVFVAVLGLVFWMIRRWVLDKIDHHHTKIHNLDKENEVLKATQKQLINEVKGLRNEIHEYNKTILNVLVDKQNEG